MPTNWSSTAALVCRREISPPLKPQGAEPESISAQRKDSERRATRHLDICCCESRLKRDFRSHTRKLGSGFRCERSWVQFPDEPLAIKKTYLVQKNTLDGCLAEHFALSDASRWLVEVLLGQLDVHHLDSDVGLHYYRLANFISVTFGQNIHRKIYLKGLNVP